MPPEPMPPQARRRWVTPESLNVDTSLVGLPLAMPWRRTLAMGIDVAVVALIAGSGDFWLIAGLLLVVMQLRSQRQGKGQDQGQGQGQGQQDRKRLGWLLAALLLWLAASQAWQLWRGDDALAAPKPAASAVAKVDQEASEAAPTDGALPAAGAIGSASAVSSATAASADSADSAAGAASQAETQSRRIARLEAQLAAARTAQPITVREQAQEIFELIGGQLGWGIVYFSLLPAWWGGQTLGKRVLRLRVVPLTGQRVTVMTSLKRYGGYAAGMATGGLGFAQVLWDPNRHGLQDKAAHTVVVDLRLPALTGFTGFTGVTSFTGIPQAEGAVAAAILPVNTAQAAIAATSGPQPAGLPAPPLQDPRP